MLQALKHILNVAMEWLRRPDPQTTALCNFIVDDLYDDVPGAASHERRRRYCEAQEFRL